MKRKATIRDVAKKAGVSIASVSLILKGVGKFADPTIKKVWAAVNELQYCPNPYARKIFSGETAEHRPTQLLMRIGYRPSYMPLQNDLQNILTCSFNDACAEYGYFGVNYLYRHELGFRNSLLLNDLVDGVVLGTHHREVIESIRGRVPAVLVNVNMDPEIVGMPLVMPDYEPCFQSAFEALSNRGYPPKIAILRVLASNLKDSVILDPDRLSGPMESAARKTVPPGGSMDVSCLDIFSEAPGDGLEKTVDAIARMVKRDNIRIFTVLQIGPAGELIRRLNQRGISLPRDAVIIKPDYWEKDLPGTIQIHVDREKLMGKAVELLVRMLERHEIENKEYLVPCRKIQINL